MGAFNDNLRRLQLERGVSNKALAAAAGATRSMVSKWRKNVVPEAARVALLATALGTTVNELLGDDLLRHGGKGVIDDPDAPAPFERDITRGYKKDDIPVVGDAEASTNGIVSWTDEGLVKGQIDRWVSRSFADGDPRAYALVVRGDSMSPRYLPGEVVVAQPRVRPRDGDYACVQLTSGERLIKRVFRKPDGWLLRSLNPAYPDREVSNDEVVAVDGIRHAIAF